MMNPARRQILCALAAATAMGVTVRSPIALGKSDSGYKAIAFDAFPIFDPRPIFKLVNTLYPEKGKQFGVLWRTRIFEYTWLLASAGKYQDFWTCIEQALVYSAKALNVELSAEQHARLMNAFLNIQAYPDVKPVLDTFKAAGIKLVFLANLTEKMLNAGINNSGLQGYFDHVISTDREKTFKPHPRAYQLGIDTLGLRRSEIVFAAFASWDAVGAKWFGYPTVWINRLGFNAETLGSGPDSTGKDLSALVKFVMSGEKSGV